MQVQQAFRQKKGGKKKGVCQFYPERHLFKVFIRLSGELFLFFPFDLIYQ